ncbi:MAG: MarC family protein [Candidatus Omnitrophota bacterium]|nr:MarC family protein [Candidatus Omnitrophota bacterium]
MAANVMLAFIPIFVAVDALGVMPIFISLTDGIGKAEKTKIILQSVITAMCLSVAFVFLGKAVFKLLHITVGDFMVAGGALLFFIAMIDIVNPIKKRRIPVEELGAVPLGTPLIAGPAVLTSSLMVLGTYGMVPTLIALFTNIVLAGFIFHFSDKMIKVIGNAGARALSKVASLLLAAIAVMMIRKGVFFIMTTCR